MDCLTSSGWATSTQGCPETTQEEAMDKLLQCLHEHGWHLDGDYDYCPFDPHKRTPGACGCGLLETDTDGDG